MEIPTYDVPDVVGKTVEEAEALQEVAGIFEIVEESHEHNTEYAEGQIIHQSPEAGRTRKSASGELIPINVTISMGARSGELVSVTGDEARSAKLRLQQTKGLSELHLNIVEAPEQEYSDEIEAGCVIRTEPAAGTILSEGDTVTLIVSKGPKILYSTMVPCVGQSVEWVQSKMDELKLKAEFTKVESTEEEGTVLTQSVDSNTEVEQGSTVTFTYSEGIKMITVPVTIDIPYSFESVPVQVFLDDQPIFEQMDVPGDQGAFSLLLEGAAGSHRLRVYISDVLCRDEVIEFREGE